MSITGNTKVKNSLVGNIHLLKTIPGYSAYEIAVKNGFEGTEKEWLASLKGDKGDPGTLENHSEIDAHGNRVVNVAAPVEDGDTVNLGYANENYCPRISMISAVATTSEEGKVPVAVMLTSKNGIPLNVFVTNAETGKPYYYSIEKQSGTLLNASYDYWMATIIDIQTGAIIKNTTVNLVSVYVNNGITIEG